MNKTKISLRSLVVAISVFALLLSAAFITKGEAGEDSNPWLGRLIIKTEAGEEHGFTVEVAHTPEAIMRGLMFRSSMPEDHGMLFLFQDERERAFWMKNTYIPLDIVFIKGDGTINHIHENAIPHDETNLPSNGPIKSVLEINGGEAAKRGIAPGDMIIWVENP